MGYTSETVLAASARLTALLDFQGDPAEFWAEYLEQLGRLVGADWVLLVSRADAEVEWGTHIVVQPGAGMRPSSAPPERFCAMIPQLADAALASAAGMVSSQDTDSFIGMSLKNSDPAHELIALFLLTNTRVTLARERLLLLGLAADRAVGFQLRRHQQANESDRQAYVKILDLVAALYGSARYQEVCISLCNELAGRFNADQVSLGFLTDEKYMRLQSISRTAHFDRKMEVVVALEKAMEEAADQDQEIILPPVDGSFSVTRAHEQLASKHGTGSLLTLPLRGEKEKVEGAVTLQRGKGVFSENEIRQVSLAVQLVAPRLLELRLTARWFPVRWALRIRKALGRLIGFEHTCAKAVALLVVCFLATLIFGKAPYRVEAPFIVKADRMTHLTAPFDGYVQEAVVRVGDVVSFQSPLLYLDRSELLLDKSAAEADLKRYTHETEKYRAEQHLADMQISAALALQAQARLDQIVFRLDQAVIRAPFRGVVVEGEWQDKLNAPVSPGDLLVKLAQLEGLYLQLDIPEEDIAEVTENASGQFAFLTAPEKKYELKLIRVHPAAVDRQKGAVFEARAGMQSASQEWWRPGMTGMAKINVGWRSLWWIFSHKTTDYLSRKLWW